MTGRYDTSRLVRVRRLQQAPLTLRLDGRLTYVLETLNKTTADTAGDVGVSVNTIRILRRRLRRIWEDAGLRWPPVDDEPWEVLPQ